MLTRDIKLEDAILDLLDNCVDGILRSKKRLSGAKPYRGFHAEIEFSRDSFSISDNCGGIPWALHEYAFRMGRPAAAAASPRGSVGVYGIGMKRAIFKMGRHCLISTHTDQGGYEVEIKPDWIADEAEWTLPVRAARKTMEEDGTTIIIGSLYPGISASFSDDAKAFGAVVEGAVASHYAFIIDKGFEVTINGDAVRPEPTRITFEAKRGRAPGIRPYIFKTTDDGVDVFLAVGFTRNIPSEDEVADAQRETRYSSLDAGWTVLCNERAVLYADRTILTGWGEAGVPRYHTQFIAISGIVEFKSDDPAKLPTTTTKRGIDASSALYIRTKQKMREGMRIFTEYTNKWKGRADESKRHMERARPLSLQEIKAEAAKLPFVKVNSGFPGRQYKPKLPEPKKLEPKQRRISFVKDVEEVERVAAYLKEPDATPSEVGEKCFDLIHRQAQK